MPRWTVWFLGSVVAPRDLDAIIGDLEEERAARLRSMSPQQVAGWYWSQVGRSLPCLLWASVRRGGLLATAAAAVIACSVQATVELATKSVVLFLRAHEIPLPAVLTLLVTVPSLVAVSYIATRIRPGAAIALTSLIVLAVTIQLMVGSRGDLSMADQIAALLVAPSAAFAGGVLAFRRRGDRAL